MVSKVSDKEHDARNFEKARVKSHQALMPYRQSPPVPKPCEESFDLPAFAGSPKFATILLRCSLSSSAMRTDQFSADPFQNMAQPISIIGFVSDQATWPTSQPIDSTCARSCQPPSGIAPPPRLMRGQATGPMPTKSNGTAHRPAEPGPHASFAAARPRTAVSIE